MMTVAYDELASIQAEAAPEGELLPDRLLELPTANDPMAFARSQSTAGVSLLLAPLRHPRLRVEPCTPPAPRAARRSAPALRLIRRGVADRVLTGGFDSMLSPLGLSGFCLLGALSTDNDAPERASRPFDLTRNGFVLGEGAGFLVLEEWSRRGAPRRARSTPSWPATAIR